MQRDAKMVSYDVIDKKGKPYVQVDVSGEKKSFSPEEISAMILGKMKETAGELQQELRHNMMFNTRHVVACSVATQRVCLYCSAGCPSPSRLSAHTNFLASLH